MRARPNGLVSAVFLGTSASPSGNAMNRLSYLHSATSSNPAHKIVMSSSSSSLSCRKWTPCSIDRTMLGVTTAGPALFVQTSSAANKALRSGVTIFPMHKGACDRKAATIKVHMRAYLNSGHDIESADQMYDAMMSSGGIPSLSVTLCDSVKAGFH